MDLHAWGTQRAQYSPARHGRKERGAALVECALIQAAAQALDVRQRPSLSPADEDGSAAAAA